MTTFKHVDGVMIFKHADVLRNTQATEGQFAYWIHLRLIVPLKDATSSGDHRQFSMLNVIETAMAVWLHTLGLSTDRMKQILDAQRTDLAPLPREQRAVSAWKNYVRMVMNGRRLIGAAHDPAFAQWERDVAAVLRRLDKRRGAVTDAQLLELLVAQRATVDGDQVRTA